MKINNLSTRLRTSKLHLILVSLVLLVSATQTMAAGNQNGIERLSRFGEYQGYSEKEYDSFVRESKYVAVRDGTKLAVSIYHPALEGKRAQGKFPTLYYETGVR